MPGIPTLEWPWGCLLPRGPTKIRVDSAVSQGSLTSTLNGRVTQGRRARLGIPTLGGDKGYLRGPTKDVCTALCLLKGSLLGVTSNSLVEG